MKTYLRHVEEHDAQSMHLSQEEFDLLLNAQYKEQPVSVVHSSDYWHDVILEDGTRIYAISGYHLGLSHPGEP